MSAAMTSKERLLCALDGGKPDRMPTSLHQWQPYHLEKYLGGIGALEAFEKFGLDAQIQYFESMGQFWLIEAEKEIEEFNESLFTPGKIDPSYHVVEKTE